MTNHGRGQVAVVIGVLAEVPVLIRLLNVALRFRRRYSAMTLLQAE